MRKEMEGDLISIVIPAWNREKYIAESIESAINQTYKNKEIIVVDNGSTDKTAEIAKSYSEVNVYSKPYGHPSTSFNYGFKKTLGKWIKYLSSDDVLYPNALEVLYCGATKTEDPYNKIFYTHHTLIDEKSNNIEQFIEPDNNHLSLEHQANILIEKYYANTNASLIHRSIFERFGLFDESVDHWEDYEFYLRVCLLHNIKLFLIPDFSVKYRIHKGQMTQNVGPLDENLKKSIIKKYQEKYKLNKVDNVY